MDHWTISLMMALLLAIFAATSSAQLLMEDSAGHHFDIDSPSDEMACYYCINVTTNEICNRYAIERPCPTDLPLCYTHHVMDASGKTVFVTKLCVTENTCSSQVGCRWDKSANQTVCVNCCDLNYCNEEVAFNASTAVFHQTQDRTAAFSSACDQHRMSDRSLTVAFSLFFYYLARSTRLSSILSID